jgi:hypothetical protein
MIGCIGWLYFDIVNHSQKIKKIVIKVDALLKDRAAASKKTITNETRKWK